MIIYLCIKYESNRLIFSNDIDKNPFLKLKRAKTPINCWILPFIQLDRYFMIIYLCIKYESNTLIFSKDIEWKPFS